VTPWNVQGCCSLEELTYTQQQYFFLSYLSLKVAAPVSNAGVGLYNKHFSTVIIKTNEVRIRLHKSGLSRE